MSETLKDAVPASEFLAAFDRIKERKMDNSVATLAPQAIPGDLGVSSITYASSGIDPLAGLKKKLHSIYSKIESITKNGDNTGQHYKYVRAVDVTEEVRAALTAIKVYAEINFDILGDSYTIARAREKDAPFTAVNVRCTIAFHDLESTAVLTTSALGTGADTGDKAIYKAQTGALKYALKNAFLIPETDKTMEPEGDSTVDEPTSFEDVRDNRRPAQSAAPKAQQKSTQNTSAAATQSGPAQPVQSTATAQSSGAKPADAPSTASATSAPAADGTKPNDKQIEDYRARFVKLGDNLALAGLKANKGLPINVKTKVYMLRQAGVNDPKEMSVEQWESFFTAAAAVPVAQLVVDVNAANGITK